MNTAKKLIPCDQICTVAEFQAAIAGHTLHFVSDRLTLMLGLWGALQPREYWIWSQLMVRVRESRSFDIKISHRTLWQYASVSEATVRGVLDRLSTLGFIEIIDKNFSPYGKKYTIRPGLPKRLLSSLKAELNRCRQKEDLNSEKHMENQVSCVHQSSSVLALSSVSKFPRTKLNLKKSIPSVHSEMILIDEKEEASENQYLSWEGKILSQEEAYLPIKKSPVLIKPYEPEKKTDWVPSFSDLKETISPCAVIPKTEEEKRRQIDVAEWGLRLQISFFRTRLHEFPNRLISNMECAIIT